MKVLKIVFSVTWLLGWGFGAGLLIPTHWYISTPMFLIAALPGAYDIYRKIKERKQDE